MYTTSTFEDVFMYADIDRIELTEIDTVRATVTMRGTGKQIVVEDDDVDLVANEIMRLAEKQVWLISDICHEYNVTVDDLRELLFDQFAPEQTYGYADGYVAGYDDGSRYGALSYDSELGEMLDYVESKAYDEGYVAGLHDGLDDADYDRLFASEQDSDSYITTAYDDYPEVWADMPLDAPDPDIISMENTVALAAQPFLARDPETDNLYVAYRIDR